MSDEVEIPVAPPTPGPSAPPAHVALVEALLFASGKPASVERLVEASELTAPEVEAALEVLERALEADARGVRLDRVAGGARLVSRNEFDVPVRKLLGLEGKNKLSMASLETLSIIAYRQPVTAPEIAELRGVNSASSLRTLLDKKLITTAGRKEVVGTPFLYKTTKEFLVHFGLKSLGDLPKPEELEAIYGLEAPKPDPAQTELFHVDEATGEVEDEAEPEAPVAAVAEATNLPSEPVSGNTIEYGTESAIETATENVNEAEPTAAPEEERHDG